MGRIRLKTRPERPRLYTHKVRALSYTPPVVTFWARNAPAARVVLVYPKAMSKAEMLTFGSNVILCLQRAVDAREESLLTLFSLSHSAVLAQFSAECFRMLENVNDSEMNRIRHAGPVTQKSLQLLATVRAAHKFPTELAL